MSERMNERERIKKGGSIVISRRLLSSSFLSSEWPYYITKSVLLCVRVPYSYPGLVRSCAPKVVITSGCFTPPAFTT